MLLLAAQSWALLTALLLGALLLVMTAQAARRLAGRAGRSVRQAAEQVVEHESPLRPQES